MLIRLLFVSLLLALHGCASVPSPQEPVQTPAVPAPLIQKFTLQGRVSVKYEEQSLSGQLRWRADEGSDEVLLSSPLGQGLANILRSEQGVTLLRPGEAPVTAQNVEDLTQSTLGFRLPLSGLRFWIQARPDPARGSEVRRNVAGSVEQISQDGWKIDYLQYSENRPRKMHVTREGLEIRLVIDEWQTN